MPNVTTASLQQALNGRLVKDSVLCTDGFRAYIGVARQQEIIHKRLDVAGGIRTIERVFHIQNVNAYYHSRLKEWINRFHGVATKYLEHYLGWFRYLDNDGDKNKNSMFSVQRQLIRR